MNRPLVAVHRVLEGPTKELPDKKGSLDSFPNRGIVFSMVRRRASKRDMSFWRAYVQLLGKREPLVDHWTDGTLTWKPWVGEQLLSASKLSNTRRNRRMVYAWLMQHCAHIV